jgi:malate dehydrogenase (oxaloacetate-decarboxylating)
MGAANVATYRILRASGVDPQGIVACDVQGTLHGGRHDVEAQQAAYADKWRVCCETNPDRVTGGNAEALRGADVCIAFSASGPDVIRPEWVRTMAANAVVFACANPVPEIWPWDALEAGARIVATGRSDFPNQINNSLGFPGIFRGTLDVRARTITDGMALAAAHELAACAAEGGLSDTHIAPRMDEWQVVPRLAVATAMQAQADGVARLTKSRDELYAGAAERIIQARAATEALVRAGVIRPMPAAG